jgi:hypothetical protein
MDAKKWVYMRIAYMVTPGHIPEIISCPHEFTSTVAEFLFLFRFPEAYIQPFLITKPVLAKFTVACASRNSGTCNYRSR